MEGNRSMRVLAPLVVLVGIVLAAASGCDKVVGVDFGAVHLADTADGAAPQADASAMDAADSGACVPQTCAHRGLNCGTQDDGCHNAIECGTCAAGSQCVAGTCKCTPKTCPALGFTCGTQDDGCGGALKCGTCAAPDACVNGTCMCQSKSCMMQSAQCGSVPDGCGNTFQCGMCPPGQTCGGSGPNKCGMTPCMPTTCSAQGKNCGTISDGCSGTLDCGSCTSPQTCGGGGTANVCGCTPTTCSAQGKNCGSIADGCSGMLSCGSCSAPQTCAGSGMANVCGCTPTTCAALGKNCGAVADGCGGNLNCGSCTSPSTCGGGGVANMCGCIPYTCQIGDCGSLPNGCGGHVYCGLCGCFRRGTRIAMADGSLRPIEQVRVGERVRSYDPGTGRFVSAEVLATPSHGFEESGGGLVVINGTLLVTPNHPIYAGGVRTRAAALRVGDTIMTVGPDGAPVPDHVRSLESTPSSEGTFDLRVGGPGTYIADGIVVWIKPV
jgi:hypothetical protein